MLESDLFHESDLPGRIRLCAKVALIVFGSGMVAKTLSVIPLMLVLFPIINQPRPAVAAMVAASLFQFLFMVCLSALITWWLLKRFVAELGFWLVQGLFVIVWGVAIFGVGRLFVSYAGPSWQGTLVAWFGPNVLLSAVVVALATRQGKPSILQGHGEREKIENRE